MGASGLGGVLKRERVEYFEPLLFDGAETDFENPVLNDDRLVQRQNGAHKRFYKRQAKGI